MYLDSEYIAVKEKKIFLLVSVINHSASPLSGSKSQCQKLTC